MDASAYNEKYRLARARGDSGWGGECASQRIRSWEATVSSLAGSERFPKGGKVLELGSGAGNLSLILAARGFDVTGVEISPAAVEWARDNAREANLAATFHAGNVTDLSRFDSASFDLVMDGNCLHCILGQDRALALNEVHRVLSSKGVFYVSTMCAPYTGGTGAPAFEAAHGVLLENGEPYRHMQPAASILAELEAAGFSIESHEVQKREWWSFLAAVCIKRPARLEQRR